MMGIQDKIHVICLMISLIQNKTHELYEMFFIIGTSIVGLQWCEVFWRGLERNKNVVQQHKRIWQNKSRKIWTWIQVSFSHNRYDKYSVSLFQNEAPAVILVKQSYNQAKSLNSIVMSMNTVESLEFVVAQFSWNLWVPIIHEFTSSTK